MAKDTKDQAFVDELMDFNPSDVSAFNEPEQKSFTDPDLYKTNPLTVDPKISKDGHYHSKVRIIYNPFDKAQSIVNSAKYAMFDQNGFFMVDSKLSMGDKNCPIFKAWKALHFSKDENKYDIDGKQYTKKEWGDHMYDKSEFRYCLVQVMEDENQPEFVGRFVGMKLPKAIYDVLQAKMHPQDPNKAPQDLMNYLFGPVLEMDVTPGPDDPEHPERKQREIKYTLCAFESDPTPIMATDGTPLFNEDEMDAITEYAENKKKATDPKASAKKKEEAIAKCKSLVDTLKDCMQRAIDYVKENAIDLVDKYGYHEPDEALRARTQAWIDAVANMTDPAQMGTTVIPSEGKIIDTGENDAEEGQGEADLPF